MLFPDITFAGGLLGVGGFFLQDKLPNDFSCTSGTNTTQVAQTEKTYEMQKAVMINLLEVRNERGFQVPLYDASRQQEIFRLGWIEVGRGFKRKYRGPSVVQCTLFSSLVNKMNQTSLRGALVLASELLDPESPKARLPQVQIPLMRIPTCCTLVVKYA